MRIKINKSVIKRKPTQGNSGRFFCVAASWQGLYYFPRLCTISKYSTLQGQPLRLSVIGAADTKPQLMIIYPLPSRPTIIKLLYFPAFRHFLFYLKKKTPAKKSKRAVPARHPQRRAAVHRSRLSISCSAHSHANAPELERVRARASCFASRSLT